MRLERGWGGVGGSFELQWFSLDKHFRFDQERAKNIRGQILSLRKSKES